MYTPQYTPQSPFSPVFGTSGRVPSFASYERNAIANPFYGNAEYGASSGQMALDYFRRYMQPNLGGQGAAPAPEEEEDPYVAPTTRFGNANLVNSRQGLINRYNQAGSGYNFKPQAGLQAGAGLPGLRGGSNPRLGGSTSPVRYW